MAQITDSITSCKQPEPPQTPPRSGCFLGCFGGSSGGSPGNKQPLLEKGESNSMKKTRGKWFSWSKLKKKSPPRRTVPIDASADEKIHQKKGNIFVIKSSKKLHKDELLAPVTEKIVHDKPNKTRLDNVEEIILENSKSMTHLDSMKKATCKKGLSHPTSPEDMFEVSRASAALSHLVSMPPQTRNKTVNISSGESKVNKEEATERKTDRSRFDQFTGMSIIMVTLIIMVFWGKICAILCTSAWFYFYPLVRAKAEPKVAQENGPKSGDELDMDSQEYKKKVVLEGFLQRNHRIH